MDDPRTRKTPAAILPPLNHVIKIGRLSPFAELPCDQVSLKYSNRDQWNAAACLFRNLLPVSTKSLAVLYDSNFDFRML